jgi:hypothetical protein
MCGITTLKGTTTFRVSDLPILPSDYFDAVAKANERQIKSDLDNDHDLVTVGLEAQELLRLAGLFPDNAILEVKKGEIRIRKYLPVHVCKLNDSEQE